ncbi:MAG: hypothetical protein OXE41_11635 [Gammaproteobacteria bacterium]|nr:hypothetical protein [Gammaproteobacteria bacterium]
MILANLGLIEYLQFNECAFCAICVDIDKRKYRQTKRGQLLDQEEIRLGERLYKLQCSIHIRFC